MSRGRGPNVAAMVLAVVAVGVFMAIGLYAMNAVFAVEDADQRGPQTAEFVPEPTNGTALVVENADIESANLSADLERAAAINQGGYVDAPANLSGFDHTTAIAVNLADGARTANTTYRVLGIENETVALWLDDGDWLAKVNASGTTEYARLNATDPHNWTTLMIEWLGVPHTLNLSANGQYTTGASDTNRSVAVSWDGRLDEYRHWTEGVSDATASQYHADPIAASPDEPDARVAFQDGSGDATVYYANASAVLRNAEWATGIAPPAIAAGTDYQLVATGNGFAIVPLKNGYLDGQPFAFVTAVGTFESAFTQLLGAVTDSYALIGVALVVLVIVPVVTTLRVTKP